MRVSDHVLSRWRERIRPDTTDDDSQITDKILRLVGNAVPVRLRSAQGRIAQLVEHGAAATHLRNNDVLLVVIDDVVTTVYWYDKIRWETIPRERSAR